MSIAVGQEPSSGYQGKGTDNQPYDQENATAVAERPGTEPVSRAQGKGAVDEPYDKGTAGANSASSALIDGILSKKKGKSTIIDTATGKPAAESQTPPATPEPATTTANGAAPTPSKLNTEVTHQKSSAPTTTVTLPRAPAATSTSTPPPSQPTPTPAASEKPPEPNRGREFQSFSGPRDEERSVSPGTLPDGRHAQTSGDKGLSYTPPSKLGKLGAKLGFGH